MASSESIGLSGLLTSQRLLDLTGHNISNAGTPGFHRQTATLAPRNYGSEIGLGVEITQMRRIFNQSIEQAITRNTFSQSDLTAQLDVLRQVEETLRPGEGSLLDLWEQLRNQMLTLAGKPDDLTGQRVLINRASALADGINALHGELARLRADVNLRLEEGVDAINDIATRIADLNANISRIVIQGGNGNDFMDQRDQLVNDLAKLIDVRAVPQDHGVVNVFAGGVPLVVSNQSLALKLVVDGNDRAGLVPADLPATMQIAGGEMHGLLALRNDTLVDVTGRLEAWALTLTRTLDGVHSTGLAATGPLDVLFGTRAVDHVNLPLASAGLGFPPQQGVLHVTITDETTGQRTLHAVTIDPATMSLSDVAAAISALPNVQGIVDAQTRTLTILAQPGFAFDFAGRLPSAPENVSISGTATPQISGAYTGSSNDTFTFTVVGAGVVGLTPGLTLEARNGAGQLLASFNIGQGYEPGAELGPVEGVRVRLGAGSVAAGDSFSTRVIGEPDTAGLLVALGLGVFFEGDQPGDLRVRADLLAHPETLAGSRSGLPADGSNWARLADALEEPLLAGGTAGMRRFVEDLIADIGSQVQDLELRQTALESLGQGLEAERQSISGVDPNEELLKMMQYQRSFQMSARFLTVVNETLQDLFLLV